MPRTIKNYTGHDVTVITEELDVITVIKSDGCARIAPSRYTEINGIRVDFLGSGVINLPNEEPDTLIIVSMAVKAAVKRNDLMTVGKVVRDENGKPMGCIGLSM